MTHRFGWVPDVPDQRDHPYKVVHEESAALPASVDLRPKCPPIVDQGQLGSCTANALTGALGFIHMDKPPASRLFIYYNERAIEGTIASDSGAMIRDGIKTLKNTGVCRETVWPYTISKFSRKPSKRSFTEAGSHTISSYQSLATLRDMQDCLASGFPFVFGFTVYESFESDQVARTGVVPMPAKSERVMGGHAVLAVGYEVDRFIVRNSWGTGWGQSGYFTMPMTYLTDPNLADDFWTVRA